MPSPSRPDGRLLASAGGALAAAVAASACCLGPLILALLGIGGAGALVALEPYRPIFAGLTVILLALGWGWTLRRERAAQGDGCGCALPRAHRTGRRLLWFATVAALASLAFPYAVPYLF